MYDRALDVLGEKLGPEHPIVEAVLNGLAECEEREDTAMPAGKEAVEKLRLAGRLAIAPA